MSEEKRTFVQNLSSTLSSSQIIMNRDLTQSNIERQNILNNRFAVENIAKSLDVVGMLFEENIGLPNKWLLTFTKLMREQ